MRLYDLVHREHRTFRAPRSGPFVGKRFLLVLPPTEADLAGARRFARVLGAQGIFVEAGSETHGEVHGERRRRLWPNLLLVDAPHREWDAIVFAGGRGAARVAEDLFARELAVGAAADGRLVAAWGEGRAALARADVAGIVADNAEALAALLLERMREAAAPHASA